MFYLNTILIPSLLKKSTYAREFYITDSNGIILNGNYSKHLPKLISNGKKHEVFYQSKDLKKVCDKYYKSYEPLTFEEFRFKFPTLDFNTADSKYYNTSLLYCLDYITDEVYQSRSIFLRFLSSDLKRPNEDENILELRNKLKEHAGDIYFNLQYA